MKEYQKAKDAFLAAKDLYDINKEDDIIKIILCCKQASICLVHDNQFHDAFNLLSALLYENALKGHKVEILTGLAKVAKIGKDVERFFTYAESALDINPSDTELRFDLAYSYSKEGHDLLSWLHYKKLTSTTRYPMALNNMGVQYDILKLPAKSIQKYFESADCNVTLAKANIARRYLDGGFINNAKEQIDSANKLSARGIEVHGNIGIAQNRLNKILKDEEEGEEQLLLEVEKERKFRVKYAEYFCCEKGVDKEKLEGVWETQWGEVNMTYDENEAYFKIDEEKEIKEVVSDTLAGMLGGKTSTNIEITKRRRIKIDGNIVKMSGKYKIEVEDKGGSLLTSGKVYEANGYMVIKEDYNTIDVMEKDEEKKLYTHTWKKK